MIKIMTLVLILCSSTAAHSKSFSTSTLENNALPSTPKDVPNTAGKGGSKNKFIADDADDKEDAIIKAVINLIGIFITILATLLGVYIAQKSPKEMAKLEKLKVIHNLATNKAWRKPDQYLVIEEAFKGYYKCYIPVDIIKLLHALDNRLEAFSVYRAVSPYCSYNQENKKITTYSIRSQNWRVAQLIILIPFILTIGIITAVGALFLMTYPMPNVSIYLKMVFAGSLLVITLLTMAVASTAFFNALSLKSEFSKLKTALPNLVQFTKESTSERNSFWLLLIVTIGFIFGLFIPVLFF